MKAKCWRCKDAGFMRGPCQNCGALRTIDGDVVYHLASLWGDNPPPMTPKQKTKRKDR